MQTITHAAMPVSGSIISSPHWDFVVELEYRGFVKLSIHQGNLTALSKCLKNIVQACLQQQPNICSYCTDIYSLVKFNQTYIHMCTATFTVNNVKCQEFPHTQSGLHIFMSIFFFHISWTPSCSSQTGLQNLNLWIYF